MSYRIVGLGEILWDMFPEGKKMGGAPANFAYHANAIADGHVDSYVVSSIGEDALGEEIRSNLNGLNINADHVAIDSTHPTGTVTVTLNENGTPSYTIDEGVAWDYVPEVPVDFVQTIDAVCFGSLAQRAPVSKHSIRHFLKHMRPDSLRIFDINLRQSFYSLDIIHQSLELSNVFKINDEEIKIVSELMGMTGTDDDLLRALIDKYELKLGVLTKGNQGSTLISENDVSHHEGYSVTVIDSVGAGDSFTAATAYGLLKGDTLDDINERASHLASFVCTCSGATPVLSEDITRIFR